MSRWPGLVLAVALVLAALPAAAAATWSGGATGNAAAKALVMPAGATPVASVSGRSVTVSWSAATIAGGAPDGYVVKRYGADDQPRSVGAGCSGTVTATTCVESGVPAGTWRYTVAARRGNWTGADSPHSAAVTVSPPSLSLDSSTVSSLPTTLSGSIANFASGETITFRLDDPTTGTALTGSTSPSPLSANGAASLTVTIPSGTSTGAHTVYAVGSGGSVASAAITVSGVSCPSSAPTIKWMHGMENGMTGGGTVSFNNGATGTATLDSAVKRHGNYSLRLSPANAVAHRGHAVTNTPSPSPIVVRYAMRLASLPSADVELGGFWDRFDATAPDLTVKYIASTGKVALVYGGQTTSAASSVVAGAWHVFEFRYNPLSDPHTADWRVDGVPQTSVSWADTTAPFTVSIYWGTRSAATYTANFDDISVSDTLADYPLGDGAVLGLLPDAMGTSVNPGNFVNDDGTALGSASWSRLDDFPMVSGTDSIKQTASSSTSYAEVTFQDTSETCIRAVTGGVVIDGIGTNQSNNGKTTIFNGSSEQTLHSGDMTSGNGVSIQRVERINPPAAAWTPAALNALRGRLGYSTDVSPAPIWLALQLQYDAAR